MFRPLGSDPRMHRGFGISKRFYWRLLGKPDIRTQLSWYGMTSLKPHILHGKVLDVGCGGGILTNALALKKSNTEFIGIDLNASSINTANFDAGIYKLSNVHFQVGRAEDANETGLNTIIMVNMMQFINTPRDIIRRTSRLLKPGKYLIIEMPPVKKSSKPLAINFREVENPITTKELLALLREEGFEIEKIRMMCRGPSNLARRLHYEAEMRSPMLVQLVYPLLLAMTLIGESFFKGGTRPLIVARKKSA